MDDWMLISALAVLFSSFISAIMIMVSRLMQIPAMEQWAKTELVFCISTVFLVVFIFLLVGVGEDLLVNVVDKITQHNYMELTGEPLDVPPSADGSPPKLIDYSLAYMNSFFSCTKSIYTLLVKINFPVELAASFRMDAFMFDIVTGWAFKGPAQTIKNITNYITFTLFIYYLFIHVMRFVQATALSVFLPLGIVLRQFPPTRGSGAFIIAFSLGFYIVFPFAYLLAVNVAPQTMLCPPLPEFEAPSMTGSADPNSALGIFGWVDAFQNWIRSTLSSLAQVGGIGLDAFDLLPDSFEPTGGKAAGFSINMCCLPFIAMVITMSFILSSTNLFGANLPEIGRGFIKLI